jgi:hypothetical protein
MTGVIDTMSPSRASTTTRTSRSSSSIARST